MGKMKYPALDDPESSFNQKLTESHYYLIIPPTSSTD